MAKLKTSADSFAEFDHLLGDKQAKTIGHNTVVSRQGEDIGVTLHSTTVITYHPNDTITLNSGGWRTVTTKDRINQLLPMPLGVYSESGVWTLSRRGNNPGTVSEFYDGMKFTVHGEMVSKVKVNTAAELRKVKRQISGYVKLYDNETVLRLVNEAVEHGTSGDCLFCQMDNQGDSGHLWNHLEEGYVMATTMRNALRFCNYRNDLQIPVVIRHGNIVRKSMRRYLVETLTTSHGARPVANTHSHFA